MLTAVQLVDHRAGVLVMVGAHVLLRYTRLGKAMRATAANKSLARNCGIRTNRVITLTWAITGALCGLAGVVFAMDAGSFDATSTDLFLILILAAVFLGGPGQAYGAMLGAVIIGLATEISAAYITPSTSTWSRSWRCSLMLASARPDCSGAPRRVNSYYIINLLIYAAVDAIGLPGAEPAVRRRRASPTSASSSSRRPARYTAAILALPSQSANGGFQTYIGGLEPAVPASRGSARPSSAA